MRLSRRQFIEFGVIGTAALVAPGAASAAPAAEVAQPLDSYGIASAAPTAREYDFASGMVRTVRWQTASARLEIEPTGVRLESPRTGCVVLQRRDFDAGYGQEQINEALGPAVLEELLHELSAYPNPQILFT